MRHVDEEARCGIHPRTVLHSDVFVCHEWRRQVTKHGQELGEWFGREVCVKEGGKER